MHLERVPLWVWVIEASGVALVLLAWTRQDFAEAALLEVGAALMLALPLSLLEQGLEGRLTETIQRAVSASVAAAETFQLSGPPVPTVPEELELWPFVAIVNPGPDGESELRLESRSAMDSSIQPIDVMIVVTDPAQRTFTTERRLNSLVHREIASFRWPSHFTSGDIRAGRHRVAWFVAPVSVGPSRRFGQVAETSFDYKEADR